MADSDTTQQVTSQTPATKQKNPKRVAAGKAIAERTRIAREEQKKALIKAQSIIAKNQVKQADPPLTETPSATETPSPVTESAKNVLTTTLAEFNQHCSFIGGDLLQARRDQKRPFDKKPASQSASRSSKLTCYAKKRHQTDGLKIN